MFGLHSNIRRISQSSSDDESPPPASVGANRVKRALFGPTDHEENLRFVKNELKKARSEASNRWNFDFDSGRPLTGQYDWEEVESTTASRTVCNPEKHSLLAPACPAPAAQEKENRLVTSCDRVEPGLEPGSGETVARPDARSRVSPETPGAGGLVTSGLVTPDSVEASPPPPGPSAAASTDSSSLGARHKTTLSKEKKLTGRYKTINVFSVWILSSLMSLAPVVFAIGLLFFIAVSLTGYFCFFQKFTGQENLGLNLPPA